MDKSMCSNAKCPLSEKCLRYCGVPNPIMQSYTNFMPVFDVFGDATCDYMILMNNFETMKYAIQQAIKSKRINDANFVSLLTANIDAVDEDGFELLCTKIDFNAIELSSLEKLKSKMQDSYEYGSWKKGFVVGLETAIMLKIIDLDKS